MGRIDTSQFRSGIKVEIDDQPFLIVSNEFVKPGKGQAFNRVRLKHMITGKVVEKTFKSGEVLELADVLETSMRMLYKDGEGVIFMCEESYEQSTVPYASLGDAKDWILEEVVYDIVFYKNQPILVTPPTFMELEIDTDPGVRGDTASGKVLKPAVTSTGAKVQVPIFIDQGEIVKIDTRNGSYVSRAGK